MLQDESWQTPEAFQQQTATHASAALLEALSLSAQALHRKSASAEDTSSQAASMTAAIAGMTLAGDGSDGVSSPCSRSSAVCLSAGWCPQQAWQSVRCHAARALAAWEAAAAATGGLVSPTFGLPTNVELMGNLAHLLGLQGEHRFLDAGKNHPAGYSRRSSFLDQHFAKAARNGQLQSYLHLISLDCAYAAHHGC